MRITSLSVAALALGCAVFLAACSAEPTDAVTDVAVDVDDTLDVAEAFVPPQIDVTLTATPDTGNAPLTVDLVADISGIEPSQLFLTWDFGDGVTQLADLEKEPDAWKVTHTFNAMAEYTVKVTVNWKVNPKKYRAEAMHTIKVQDPAALSVSLATLMAPVAVKSGDEVSVAFSITNEGDAVTTPFQTVIRMSTDAVIDDGDVVLHTFEHQGIGSGKLSPVTENLKATFNLPKNLVDGSYWVLLRVDDKQVINEINRTDNENFATDQLVVDSKAAAEPDLSITAPEFASDETYSPGQALGYTLTIGNSGEGEAKAVKFGVFASLDKKLDYDFTLPEVCETVAGKKVCVEDPKQIDKRITKLADSNLQKIAPMSSLPLLHSTGVPELADGSWYLIAKVDTTEAIHETNEDNNLAVSANLLKIQKVVKKGIDLALTSMAVKPKGTYLNGAVTVEWSVLNTGTDASPSFPASIYLCPTKAFSKTTCNINQTNFSVAPLVAGEAKSGSQVVTISPQTPAQKWYVYLLLDPDQKIAELDEGNNAKMFDALSVALQANVDLRTDSVGFHPESVAAGGALKISHMVYNDGSTGAGASNTWYALSATNTCTLASVASGKSPLLGKVSFSGVDGLESTQVNAMVPVPVGLDHSVSDWYVCVFADGDGALTKDTNKTNNISVSAVPVKVLDPKGGCFEDAADTAGKSNDTLAAAAEVQPGVTQGLGACGNEDWWKVQVPLGHSLLVTLTAQEILWTTPVPALLDLDLVAPDGKTLADSLKYMAPVKKATALSVAQAGTWYIRVYGHTAEARAKYALDVKVVPPAAGIDLLAANLTVTPQATWPGGLVKSKFRLANLGDQPSGAFGLKYVLSTDAVLDSKDAVLKNVTFDLGIPAASSQEVLTNLLLPVVPGGGYYVGVLADPTSTVVEVDETNNAAMSSQLVLSTTASCATDAFTGNHTVDEAALLPSQMATYKNLNVCPGLEDWFRVEVPTGKMISATIAWSYVAGQGVIGVQLVDASKTGVVAGSANPMKTQARLPYVQSGGTFYVHVYVLPESGQALPHDYTLTLEVADPDPTDVCLADYFEANNSAQSAAELGCGLSELTLCLGDEDWFRLAMNKGESVQIGFEHTTQAFALRYYSDPNLPPIQTQNTNGTVKFVAPEMGDYYMQVVYKTPDVKPSTFAYKLQVDGGKGIDLTAKIANLFPAQVVQGEDVYLTSEIRNECKDPAGAFEYAYYYSLDAKLDSGDHLLLTKPLSGVAGKSMVSMDDKAALPVDAKPGPAFLILAADATQSVAETQELNNTASTAVEVIQLCLADALEPNGSPQIATPLPMGKTVDLSLCPYDFDWQVVSLAQGETLTVTLEFDTAVGDLDMRLYAAGKFASPVATAATKQAPEQLVFGAAVAGKYYLRINGFSGDANAYTLYACKSMTGKCVECADDAGCGELQSCDPTTTMCVTKKCTPEDLTPCDDGNACTVEGCNENLQCTWQDTVGTPCSDGNACTEGEACEAGGVCAIPPPVECNDDNPCTTDACDPGQGCVSTPVTDATPCGDGVTCQAGVCQ